MTLSDAAERERQEPAQYTEGMAEPLHAQVARAQLDAQGQRLIWLEARVIDKLTALRGHGESYSDVILRLVELEARSLILR